MLLPLAAAVALAHTLPASLAIAVDAAPLIVLGAGALLALITRRARLLVGVVILALADSALVNAGSRSVFDAVALLLPLNLAIVVWLGDENPVGGRGGLFFAITLLQVAVITVLLSPQLKAVTESLDVPLAGAHLWTWTSLSPLSVVSFAAALGLLVARVFLYGQALAIGAAWALVASFLALDGASSGGPVGAHFAVAGALLLAGARREPRHYVATDMITHLPTRIELQRAVRRLTKRYAVAFVEVDDFAAFRDEHGVPAAHRMLRLVAQRLGRTFAGARAYYCDGATFAVLFPGLTAERALRCLDAVRAKVEAITLNVSLAAPPTASRRVRPGIVQRTVSVTISAGVAEVERPGDDPRRVIEAAERALGRARDGGMNRVSR